MSREQQEIDRLKLQKDEMSKMHEDKISKMQQAHRTEVEALAAQNREIVQQLEEARQQLEMEQSSQRDTAKWLSEASDSMDRLDAEIHQKDAIIFNLSKYLAHVAGS